MNALFCRYGMYQQGLLVVIYGRKQQQRPDCNQPETQHTIISINIYNRLHVGSSKTVQTEWQICCSYGTYRVWFTKGICFENQAE